MRLHSLFFYTWFSNGCSDYYYYFFFGKILFCWGSAKCVEFGSGFWLTSIRMFWFGSSFIRAAQDCNVGNNNWLYQKHEYKRKFVDVGSIFFLKQYLLIIRNLSVTLRHNFHSKSNEITILSNYVKALLLVLLRTKV